MAMWDNCDNREWQSPEQMRIQAEASRLNVLISEEETKLNNMYCQIGKLYVTVHQDDSEEEFAGLMAAVLESESKIGEYRAQILDIKGLVCCPQCGMELPKGAAFCMSCGTPIPKVEAPAQGEYEKCANCGAMVVTGMRFCTTCGSTMEAQSVAALEEATPAEIPVKLACANCGMELEADALFCAQCGTPVQAAASEQVENEICEEPVEAQAAEETPYTRYACANCGAVLEDGALFCAQCGVSVKDAVVPYVPEEGPWDKAELELDSADEEIPAETPEKSDSPVVSGFGALMAAADLDEDDNWEEPAAEAIEEAPVQVPAPAPEEMDAWDEPVEAPALYIVKEEPPVEIPEKPLYAHAAGFGVLMAPSDLDDDDMWGEPVAAPAVEELPEELPLEAPAKPVCANCGAELDEDFLFCTECGTPVAKTAASGEVENDTCRGCGALVEKGMRFCTECGMPMEARAVTSSGKRFCLTCGAVLEDDVLFCTECGTKV